MSAARALGVVVCAYMALTGGAVAAWIAGAGHGLTWSAGLVCALPLAIGTLVVACSGTDLEQDAGKLVACFGMLPILLLMWGASYEPEEAGTEPTAVADEPSAAPSLDTAQLFAGAHSVEELPMTLPELVWLRTALFDDGSELRLWRFARSEGAARQRAFLVSTQGGRPWALPPAQAGERPRHGVRFGPADASLGPYLELHGRDLLEVRAKEMSALRARLASVPAPGAEAAAANGVPPAHVAPASKRAVWPFALSFSLLHALAFCAFIVWAGARTTRVAARAGPQAASVDRLRERLLSLDAAGLPCRISPGEHQLELLVDFHQADPRRAHRAVLTLDARERYVTVREILGASGAAPRSAAEADMRGVGEARFDPSRPRAQKVWASVVQTSILEPERLALLARTLELEDQRVGLHDLGPTLRDPDALLHLLCAVVTGSGFDWRPVLWKRRA